MYIYIYIHIYVLQLLYVRYMYILVYMNIYVIYISLHCFCVYVTSFWVRLRFGAFIFKFESYQPISEIFRSRSCRNFGYHRITMFRPRVWKLMWKQWHFSHLEGDPGTLQNVTRWGDEAGENREVDGGLHRGHPEGQRSASWPAKSRILFLVNTHGGFHRNSGIPQKGGFIRENPIKWMI